MCEITYNGIVNVNRGDSFYMDVPLSTNGKLFPINFDLTENDYVYLGVMEPNQPFEDALIRKVATVNELVSENTVRFKFAPQDTQCVLPGRYYYQVKIQKCNPLDSNDYEVCTLIDKTQFFILE